jgi:hypothetical protein
MSAPPPSYPFGLPVGVDEAKWQQEWREWRAAEAKRQEDADHAAMYRMRMRFPWHLYPQHPAEDDDAYDYDVVGAGHLVEEELAAPHEEPSAMEAKVREIVEPRVKAEVEKLLAQSGVPRNPVVNPEDEMPPAAWYAMLADLRRTTAPLKAYYDARAPPQPPEWSTVPNIKQPSTNLGAWNRSTFAWLFTKKAGHMVIQLRLFNKSYKTYIVYYDQVKRTTMLGRPKGDKWAVAIEQRRGSPFMFKFVEEANAFAFYEALTAVLR